MSESCFICKRIHQIKEGINPYFVKELETGYIVLGDGFMIGIYGMERLIALRRMN